MEKERIAALILSAGSSSRMGYPKALLKYKGKSFWNIISEKILLSGISDLNLVLGAGAERINEELSLEGVKVIINKDWKQGQLSSLKIGIRNISYCPDGIMVFLIDHPLVDLNTINILNAAFAKTSADVLIPEYGGKGGHPVLYRKTIFKDLLDLPLEIGARALYSVHGINFLRIPVNDAHIRQDIDTMEEFKELSYGN